MKHGQSGDLGAAALKAVAEGNRKGNACALAASAAQEIALRQDFAIETLVLVGFMNMFCIFSPFLKLRSNGQTGDLGQAAVRAVAEDDPADTAHVLVEQPVQEKVLMNNRVTATLVQVSVFLHNTSI